MDSSCAAQRSLQLCNRRHHFQKLDSLTDEAFEAHMLFGSVLQKKDAVHFWRILQGGASLTSVGKESVRSLVTIFSIPEVVKVSVEFCYEVLGYNGFHCQEE